MYTDNNSFAVKCLSEADRMQRLQYAFTVIYLSLNILSHNAHLFEGISVETSLFINKVF